MFLTKGLGGDKVTVPLETDRLGALVGKILLARLDKTARGRYVPQDYAFTSPVAYSDRDGSDVRDMLECPRDRFAIERYLTASGLMSALISHQDLKRLCLVADKRITDSDYVIILLTEGDGIAMVFDKVIVESVEVGSFVCVDRALKAEFLDPFRNCMEVANVSTPIKEAAAAVRVAQASCQKGASV